jgi:hypothetical protein
VSICGICYYILFVLIKGGNITCLYSICYETFVVQLILKSHWHILKTLHRVY